MAQPPVYPPLTNPIIVAGPQFCAPNYTVTIGDNILFTVQPRLLSLHCRHVLYDANGNPIITMRKNILSLHWRCEVFRGDSCNSENLLFSTKTSSMIQFQAELDVFLAGNTEERVCDFKVKGSLLKSSCKIYVGESSNIIAQMQKKGSVESMLFGNSKFTVNVSPNVDLAFIVPLIIIFSVVDKSAKQFTHQIVENAVDETTGCIHAWQFLRIQLPAGYLYRGWKPVLPLPCWLAHAGVHEAWAAIRFRIPSLPSSTWTNGKISCSDTKC